jgi:Protein of unknown function (DUF3240)
MNQLLVIHVPGDIREDVIDALIAYEEITGFSLSEISGYSREHSQYNLEEQVAGYRVFYRFEVHHQVAQENDLLRLLDDVCNASHARYWIVPVSRSGSMGFGHATKDSQ